jgi:AsmA protein|tara:strand:- start:2730 stop:4892 length:2163 start_codon:yes stop_codon:yes gene_type:complete
MSRILIGLAVIVMIPIVFAVGLLLLLDSPEYYRQQLAATAQEQTGFELRINGDLNWRYWPPIAIDITDVEVLPTGADIPLASFSEASVDLKLLPLVTGSNAPAIDGFSIDGLELNALIDAQGNANWEVSDVSVPSAPADRDPSATDSDTSSEEAIDLAIEQIEITNSVINYQDLSSNSQYRLDLHSLTTGSVVYDRPTQIRFDLSFEDKVVDARGTTTGSGQITFDSDFNRFEFSQLRLDNKIQVSEMAPMDLSLSINGNADLHAGTASLDDSSVQISELEGTLNLDVKDLNSSPQISGRLQVSPFNAKALLRTLNQPAIETANPNAGTNIAFSTDLSGSTEDISFDNIEATVDNSKLKGRMDVHMGDKIGVNFDLEMDRIIASDYLQAESAVAAAPSGRPSAPTAAENEAATQVNEAATQVSEDSEVIPVDLLDEYELGGEFRLHSVTYDTYTFNDLRAEVENANQRLNFKLRANGYDGEAKLDIEARTDKPGGRTSFDVSSINITKFTDFEWITGTLRLNSTTRFNGKMLSEVLESLDGTSKFTIEDGTLDITPIKRVASVIDSLREKSSGISEWPDKLPFEQLNGEHKLDHGIAADQKLNLQLENLTINGKGGVDYWQNTLLYDLNVVLDEAQAGQFQVNPSITGVRWPLHCEGAMDESPITLCRPDDKAIQIVAADLVKREVKRQGREKLQKKIEDKIPGRFKEKAKKLLKGLFDN